ncbi:MAG: hypothetical protein V4598_13410 [Bdellovibrionota bacterium]
MKLIAVLILIAGCSVTQKTMIGPDGTKHKLISCSVVEDCYKKAKSICGTYTIVNTSNEGAGDARVVKLLVKCDEKK